MRMPVVRLIKYAGVALCVVLSTCGGGGGGSMPGGGSNPGGSPPPTASSIGSIALSITGSPVAGVSGTRYTSSVHSVMRKTGAVIACTFHR